jgi:serine/threonine protein kinase
MADERPKLEVPDEDGDVAGVPQGTVVGGRYRLIKPLMSGGMASVFVADDLKHPGTMRAVKLMAPRLLKDAKSRERFEQEALIGRAIKHPNIVDVLGAGVDPALESPWIAMELLEGGTLAETVQKRGKLTLGEVRGLFTDFGSALDAAHKAGVVHRDLKPENLFLEARPSKSQPYTLKVLDFGIAKVKKDVTMKNSQLIGSPMWMAPEQLSPGTSLGPFTDVWPFGLIAFFALVGKPYWTVANERAINLPKLLVEIMTSDFVAPSARAKELGVEVALPPEFDAWFLRCVARDPVQRFASIADAAHELDHALQSRPSPSMKIQTQSPTADPPRVETHDPVVLPTGKRAPWAMVATAIGLMGVAALAYFLTR